MKTLSVGVVIPGYNAAAVIGSALQSALDQSPPPEEIVVVDDGSVDETASIVQKFRGVRYVKQPNRGPSAARNRGWRELGTDAVVFLDADDILLPEGLSVRRNLLADGETAWAYTEGFLEDGAGKRWPFSESYPRGDGRRDGPFLSDLLCRNFVCTSGTIVRWEALEDTGGFDESFRLVEDWDLWLRLAVRHPPEFSSTPTFVQRLAPHTLSSDRDGMIRMRYHVLVKFHRLFPREVLTAGPRARRSVADAHNWFGYTFAGAGLWDRARPSLRTSVRLWPAQRRAWWLLIRCLANAHRPGGALGSPPNRRDPGTGLVKE
jgi:glycosyltransferase involved in cell wall biosynthesis